MREPILLRAPNGLGDAIYLRAIVLHFLGRGEDVTVFTKWPDVFYGLPILVKCLGEITDKTKVRYALYPQSMKVPPGKSDFAMWCKRVGIDEPVELRINWKIRNAGLLEQIKRDAAGRKIFVYQCSRQLRKPVSELLKPRREAFNAFIARHSDCYRIKLGHPPHVDDDPGAQCELDMFGKAFIFDTFDICTIGDEFFGQASFIGCIAEALDKPHTVMFARAALKSGDFRANTTTPERCFHKKHLATAVYDDGAEFNRLQVAEWTA